jgi:hypothetical protein
MAKFSTDRARLHVQTNNPTEEQLRKDELEEGGEVKGWLETCGPTAMVNCLDALGVDIAVATPGGYAPQPEEVASDYFNDPANYPKFHKVRDDLGFDKVQGNRIPNLYPHAAKELFATEAIFFLARSWNEIVSDLLAGYAVQLCLKSPGHFIAAVDYDPTSGEIIYHDSWPARTGTDGFRLRMGLAEYEANVQACAIVYTGGKA